MVWRVSKSDQKAWPAQDGGRSPVASGSVERDNVDTGGCGWQSDGIWSIQCRRSVAERPEESSRKFVGAVRLGQVIQIGAASDAAVAAKTKFRDDLSLTSPASEANAGRQIYRRPGEVENAAPPCQRDGQRDDRASGGHDGQDDEEAHEDEHEDEHEDDASEHGDDLGADEDDLESGFRALGQRFRKFMNFYGIIEDASLALAEPSAWRVGRVVGRAHPANESERRARESHREAAPPDVDREAGPKLNSCTELRSHRHTQKPNWMGLLISRSAVLLWCALLVFANLSRVYIFINHMIGDVRIRFDFSRPASSNQSLAADEIRSSSSSSTGVGGDAASAVFETTSLRLFFSNLRRQMWRTSAILTAVVWNKSYRRFELLFHDCHIYHKTILTSRCSRTDNRADRKTRAGGRQQEKGPLGPVGAGLADKSAAPKGSVADLLIADCRATLDEAYDGQDRPSGSYRARSRRELYNLVRWRTNLACAFPFLYLLFNLFVIMFSPYTIDIVSPTTANVLSTPDQQQQRKEANLSAGSNLSASATAAAPNATSHSSPASWRETVGAIARYMIRRMIETYESNHRSAGTEQSAVASGAPVSFVDDFTISALNDSTPLPSNTGTSAAAAAAASYQQLIGAGQLGLAVYAVFEIIAYHVYFQGPKTMCATCVSVLLAKHCQCFDAFNRQLAQLVWRMNANNNHLLDRSSPKSFNYRQELIRLLKQYDIICAMHHRLERAFKWSLILWSMAMFITCLMRIFSFTELMSESTNRFAVLAAAAAAAAAPSPLLINSADTSGRLLPNASSSSPWLPEVPVSRQSQQQQNQQQGSVPSIARQPIGWPNLAASLVPFLIMLARLAFEAYPLNLIYIEAFKIESLSCKSNKLVLLIRQIQQRQQLKSLAAAAGDQRKSRASTAASATTDRTGTTDLGADRSTSRLAEPLLESSLFEPQRLGAGDYFSLTKRTMCTFMAAIVTFSVMFMGPDSDSDPDSDPGPEPEPEADADAGPETTMAQPDDRSLASDIDDNIGADSDASGADSDDDDYDEADKDQGAVASADDYDDDNDLGSADADQDSDQDDDDGSSDDADYAAAGSSPSNESIAGLGSKFQLGPVGAAAEPKPIALDMGKLAPRLADNYFGHVRENERLVELEPRLRILNHVEVCDFELRNTLAGARSGRAQRRRSLPPSLAPSRSPSPSPSLSPPPSPSSSSNRRPGAHPYDPSASRSDSDPDSDPNPNPSASPAAGDDDGAAPPFFVSWIDRIKGEATLEARLQPSAGSPNGGARGRAVGARDYPRATRKINSGAKTSNLHNYKQDDYEDTTATSTQQRQLNCERQRNYTIGIRAIGCNGLVSNEALVSIVLDDVNEFSPKFERSIYTVFYELTSEELTNYAAGSLGAAADGSSKLDNDRPDDRWRHLVQVRAHDSDCSRELYGRVCRYELVDDFGGDLAIDSDGNIRAKLAALVSEWSRQQQRPQPQPRDDGAAGSGGGNNADGNNHDDAVKLERPDPKQQQHATSASSSAASLQQQIAHQQQPHDKLICQVVAYDCGGKKSAAQAIVELSVGGQCAPKWKDAIGTRLTYRPLSGEQWLFAGTQLDLCARKCLRPSIAVTVQLDTFGQQQQQSAPQRLDRPVHADRQATAPANDSDHRNTTFHCDRDSYSMVSKRRLCGSSTRAIELLPRSIDSSPQSDGTAERRTNSDAHVHNNNELGDRSSDHYHYHSSLTRNGAVSMLSNLAAYSPAGSYGLFAIQYARSLQQQQQHSNATVPLSADGFNKVAVPAGRKLHHNRYKSGGLQAGAGAAAGARQYNRQRRAHQRSSSSPLGADRVSAADAPFVYRDQVYRFDGITSAVIVPSRVLYGSNYGEGVGDDYSGDDNDDIASNGPDEPLRDSEILQHHQQVSGDNSAAAAARRRRRRPERELDRHLRQRQQHLIFGPRHTMSFWMRHEAPTGNEVADTGPAKQRLRHRQQQLRNSSREYLVCATTATTTAPNSGDDNANANARHRRRARQQARKQYRPDGSGALFSIRKSRRATVAIDTNANQQPDYALYIRNCKLNLLIRQPAPPSAHLSNDRNQSSLETTTTTTTTTATTTTATTTTGATPRQQQQSDARPLVGEWRWIIDNGALCDNKWHLYTLNVNYPLQVELYVDGQQFAESYTSVEQETIANSNNGTHPLFDDLYASSSQSRSAVDSNNNDSAADNDNMQMHMSKSHTHMHSQRAQSDGSNNNDDIVLSVGACWDPFTQLMGGYFRGSLSGLVVVPNTNDDTSTIECLGRCSESLVSSMSAQLASSRRHNAGRGSTQAAINRRVGVPADRTVVVDGDVSENSIADEQSKTSKGDDTYGNSLVAYQDSAGRISLIGHDLLDVEEALAQVAYVNKRAWPSIGRRTITVNTDIECQSQQSANSSNQQRYSIPINPMRINLDVLPSTKLPVIAIEGPKDLAYDPQEVGATGVRVFARVHLRVTQTDLLQATNNNDSSQSRPSPQHHTPTISVDDVDYIDDSTNGSVLARRNVYTSNNESNGSNIEACSIRIEPAAGAVSLPYDDKHESVELPRSLVERNNLYHYRSRRAGFALIYGVDSAGTYERVLRSVVYRNTDANATRSVNFGRLFRLICSDMNGRLVSDEYRFLLSMMSANDRPQSDLASTSGASSMSALDQSDVSLDQVQAQPQPQQLPAASILRQNSPELSMLDLGPQDEWKLPFKGSGGEHNREPMFVSPLLPETMQSAGAKLNRIAMAFLLFVISLILIMLVIALTNLKEQSTSQMPRAMLLSRRNHRTGKNVPDEADEEDDDLDDDEDCDEDDGESGDEDEEEDNGEDDFNDRSTESTRTEHRTLQRKNGRRRLIGTDGKPNDRISIGTETNVRPLLTAISYDAKSRLTKTRTIGVEHRYDVDRPRPSMSVVEWLGRPGNSHRGDGQFYPPAIALDGGCDESYRDDDFVIVDEYDEEQDVDEAIGYDRDGSYGDETYDQADTTAKRRRSDLLAWDESASDTTIVVNPIVDLDVIVGHRARQKAADEQSDFNGKQQQRCIRCAQPTMEEIDETDLEERDLPTTCDEEDDEDGDGDECCDNGDDLPCECHHHHHHHLHHHHTHSRDLTGAHLGAGDIKDKSALPGVGEFNDDDERDDDCYEYRDDDEEDCADETADESGRYYELLHRHHERNELIPNMRHYPCRRELTAGNGVDKQQQQVCDNNNGPWLIHGDSDSDSDSPTSLAAALTAQGMASTSQLSKHSSTSTLVGVASPEHDGSIRNRTTE